MALDSVRNALLEHTLRRLTAGTARGLVATGPAQAAFMNQVGRAHATNALTRGLSGGGDALTNLLLRSAAPQGANALLGR